MKVKHWTEYMAASIGYAHRGLVWARDDNELALFKVADLDGVQAEALVIAMPNEWFFLVAADTHAMGDALRKAGR